MAPVTTGRQVSPSPVASGRHDRSRGAAERAEPLKLQPLQSAVFVYIIYYVYFMFYFLAVLCVIYRFYYLYHVYTL